MAGYFTAEEAAQLGKQIQGGLIILCHYEMFEFNTVLPGTFEDAAKRIIQPCRMLKCGERVDL